MTRSLIALATLTSAAAATAQSPVPDRILLHYGDDPATSLTVTWRTDVGTKAAFGQIAVATDGPGIRETRGKIAGTTKPVTVAPPPASDADGRPSPSDVNYHEVAFTGLRPNTLYAYRIGNGKVWSEWFHARTAAATAAGDVTPFRFVYVGDAQNDIKSLWSRVMRQAYGDAPDAAFLLHAGDLVNRADSDAEWGEWFHGGGFVFGQTPSIAVPGNHEYTRRPANSPAEQALQSAGIWQGTLSDRWDERFAFPFNGPDGLEETAYYYDVNGVRVIGLNSMAALQSAGLRGKQTVWLRQVLEDNPGRWTIVTHHHPIHSSSRGRDNLTLRESWQPVYDEFGVDLVLQGHDHSYGRSGLLTHEDHADHGHSHGVGENLTTGLSTQAGHGTVYVVSVSGPKQYPFKKYPEEENPFVARGEFLQLYQVIDVTHDAITYEARTATGRLHDRFVLTKDETGHKRITQ